MLLIDINSCNNQTYVGESNFLKHHCSFPSKEVLEMKVFEMALVCKPLVHLFSN